MDEARVLLGPCGWKPAPRRAPSRLQQTASGLRVKRRTRNTEETAATRWAYVADVQVDLGWEACARRHRADEGDGNMYGKTFETQHDIAWMSHEDESKMMCVQDVLEAVCAFVYGPDYDSEALVRAGLYRERDGVMHLLPLDIRFVDCMRAFPVGARLVFREHGFAQLVRPYMQASPDAARAELQFREALFRLQQGHFRASSIIHAGELLALAYLGMTCEADLVSPEEAAGTLCAFAADFKPEALCGRAGLPAVISQALGSYGELTQRWQNVNSRKAAFVRTVRKLFASLWEADFFSADRVHTSAPPSSSPKHAKQRPRRRASSQAAHGPVADCNVTFSSAPFVSAETSNHIYYGESDINAAGARREKFGPLPAHVEWFAVNFSGIHVCMTQDRGHSYPLKSVQSWTSSADGAVLALAMADGRVIHLAGIPDRGAETAATLIGLYVDASNAGWISANGIRRILTTLRGVPLSTVCRTDVRVYWPEINAAPTQEMPQHNKPCDARGQKEKTETDERSFETFAQAPEDPALAAQTSSAVNLHHAEPCPHSPAVASSSAASSFDLMADCEAEELVLSSVSSSSAADSRWSALRQSMLRALLRKTRRQYLARALRLWRAAAQQIVPVAQVQAGFELRDARRTGGAARLWILWCRHLQRELTVAWRTWTRHARQRSTRTHHTRPASQEQMDLPAPCEDDQSTTPSPHDRADIAFRRWKLHTMICKKEWRVLFIAWDRWTMNAQLRRQLRRLSQGWSTCRLSTAFATWKAHIEVREAAHSLQDVLSRALNQVRKQRGMNCWKQFVMVQMMKQGVALEALTRFVSQYALRQAWDRFLCAYASSNASIFTRLVHQAMRRQRLSARFSQWKRFVMFRAAEESYAISTISDIFSRYLAQYTSASLREHFHRWRRWTALVSLQHALASGLRRTTLLRGLSAWKRFVMTRTIETSYGASLIAEALESCMLRTRTMALTRCLARWREWARASTMGVTLSTVMDRLLKRRGFAAWKRFDMLRTMECTWALDRMAEFYLKHCHDDQVRYAFSAWRQHAAAAAASHGSAGISVTKYDRRGPAPTAEHGFRENKAPERATIAVEEQDGVEVEVKQADVSSPSLLVVSASSSPTSTAERDKQMWDMRLRLARCQQSISRLEHACRHDLRLAREAMQR